MINSKLFIGNSNNIEILNNIFINKLFINKIIVLKGICGIGKSHLAKIFEEKQNAKSAWLL